MIFKIIVTILFVWLIVYCNYLLFRIRELEDNIRIVNEHFNEISSATLKFNNQVTKCLDCMNDYIKDMSETLYGESGDDLK